jgi:hypothetical protein
MYYSPNCKCTRYNKSDGGNAEDLDDKIGKAAVIEHNAEAQETRSTTTNSRVKGIPEAKNKRSKGD